MKQMLQKNKPRVSMTKFAQSEVQRMKASALAKPQVTKIIKKVNLLDL